MSGVVVLYVIQGATAGVRVVYVATSKGGLILLVTNQCDWSVCRCVVCPGFDSTSTDFVRSRASHPLEIGK